MIISDGKINSSDSNLAHAAALAKTFLDTITSDDWAKSKAKVEVRNRLRADKFGKPLAASELIELVPPLMPTLDRLSVVEAIWRQCQVGSHTDIYFGRAADFKVFWNTFKDRADKLQGEYLIPKSLTAKYKWLNAAESIAQQRRLNQFRSERSRLKFAAMIRAIRIGLDQMAIRDRSHRCFTHDVEIEGNVFRLFFDNETRGISFNRPLEKVPSTSTKILKFFKSFT